MNIQVVHDYGQLCDAAAYIIASQVITKPDSVIGTASGGTVLGVYSKLVDLYEQGLVDFSSVKIFNNDEFQGLDKEHTQSRFNLLSANLIDRININPDNFHIPKGTAKEDFPECKRYEKSIDAAGGVDLQILGIGVNGHIGFNEPSDFFAPYTYLADLNETTREANVRFFGHISKVPQKAYSVGVGTIMRARKIILVAEGEWKAQAIKAMIQKRVTPQLPASILQFHGNVTVIIDEKAASML